MPYIRRSLPAPAPKDMFDEDDKCDNVTPCRQKAVASYKVFLLEQKSRLKASYPFLAAAQINRKVRQMWQKLRKDEKNNYTKIVLYATPLKSIVKRAKKVKARSLEYESQETICKTVEKPKKLKKYVNDYYQPESPRTKRSFEKVQDWLGIDDKESKHVQGHKTYKGARFMVDNYLTVPEVIEDSHFVQTGILKSAQKLKKSKVRVSFSGKDALQSPSTLGVPGPDSPQSSPGDEQRVPVVSDSVEPEGPSHNGRQHDVYDFDTLDQYEMYVDDMNSDEMAEHSTRMSETATQTTVTSSLENGTLNSATAHPLTKKQKCDVQTRRPCTVKKRGKENKSTSNSVNGKSPKNAFRKAERAEGEADEEVQPSSPASIMSDGSNSNDGVLLRRDTSTQLKKQSESVSEETDYDSVDSNYRDISCQLKMQISKMPDFCCSFTDERCISSSSSRSDDEQISLRRSTRSAGAALNHALRQMEKIVKNSQSPVMSDSPRSSTNLMSLSAGSQVSAMSSLSPGAHDDVIEDNKTLLDDITTRKQGSSILTNAHSGDLCEMFGDLPPSSVSKVTLDKRRLVGSSKTYGNSNFADMFAEENDIFL